MTPGQDAALSQIERIASRSNALEIVEVRRPDAGSTYLNVVVSVYCGDMPKVAGGLPLRGRERVTIQISARFPYDIPTVVFGHHRYAGHAHVQWLNQPCLFQAPHTEWRPSAGMFGLLERLEIWLRKSASNELDPIGAPLHPPVAYGGGGPWIIPRADTPKVETSPWLGFAGLRMVSDRRIDVVDWNKFHTTIAGDLVGPAILLNQAMPFEFPSKFGDLLTALRVRGVTLSSILDLLQKGVERNGEDKPLYLILGTPMRRPSGDELRQHLTVWRVNATAVTILGLRERIIRTKQEFERLSLQTSGSEAEGGEDLEKSVSNLFVEWAEDVDVIWSRVREDRAEVTVRRDIGKSVNRFADKSIEIWGCGALGAYVAEILIRAGVRRLVIRDNGVVTPGVLIRQPYFESDIGEFKVEALATRLRLINPQCEILSFSSDVIYSVLSRPNFGEDADLIIDATASNLVATRTEQMWTKSPVDRKPVASIAIDRDAMKLLVVFATPKHSSGPLGILRQMKLLSCRDERLSAYRDAFFPEILPAPFQPEPGCSDATFVGSSADSMMLAAAAANYIGKFYGCESTSSAFGCFVPSMSASSPDLLPIEQCFEPEYTLRDSQTNFEVRIDPAAMRALRAWQSESRRIRGLRVETGGILFGEVDEFLQVIWVSELSGPPSDSRHSAEEFVCGIDGLESLTKEKSTRTRKSAQYLGTWHTHPVSEAIPSAKDFNAMSTLLTETEIPVEQLLLLIVGRSYGKPEVSATVFLRSEFETLKSAGCMCRRISVQALAAAERESPRVGIALSGGGARAIAFHLGCMRALNDLQILPKAEVISTVSGGSVIGAMYFFSDETFAEFDDRVCDELRRGLMGSIARQTLLSRRAIQICATKLVSGTAANASFIARFLVRSAERVLPRKSKGRGLAGDHIQPPLRRWVSRTQAFEDVLRDRLFGKAKIKDKYRSEMEIVINACELRSGTAFRFGSRESGSWRTGQIEENDVEVATAVAASAAFPAMLPAIDRYMSFIDRKGDRRRRRVILTDGGVYENLGVSCMTPDRREAYSTNVFHPSYLICCDAGPGQFSDIVLPYGWTTRMRRAFETTFRQTQHGLQNQLHMWKAKRAICGFVYSYLGQQDKNLPIRTTDLVTRDQVVHYPTDFSRMSTTDIDLLSRRGEQLTRMLVQH